MADRFEPPFWLVWRDGGRPPVYKHPDYKAARREAERLAQANPGAAFYVLAPAARGVSPEGTIVFSHWTPSEFYFDNTGSQPDDQDVPL